MSWRVAKSLDVLLTQLNQHAPQRSRLSDGSIGYAAHASRSSDHNPWYGPGIVTARDFTHDPAGGLDGQWLADTLVRNRDPRVKYVIWNRRMVSSYPTSTVAAWVWRPYSGINAHAHHLHVSVLGDPCCDDVTRWQLTDPTAPAALAVLQQGSVGPAVTLLQQFLKRAFAAYAGGLVTDGDFGPRTTLAVQEFQRRTGLTPDGIVGPVTARELAKYGYRP
jgi:hypothetical protein